jgi:hypothetical protein
MYALKLELKLNNSERTIMARHAGYARFCYNLALSLYLGVVDIKVSRTRKIALIKKTFTNFIKKQPEYQWTNTLSSRVYQNAFIAFNSALERFFKGRGGFPNFFPQEIRGLLYRRQQQWTSISDGWQSDKNSHIGNVSPERSYPVQLLLSNIYHQS